MLSLKVIICKPADPEAKGLFERAHGYVERSLLLPESSSAIGHLTWQGGFTESDREVTVCVRPFGKSPLALVSRTA